MNYKKLIKKIRSNAWWSEESPGNYQQAFWAWRGFVSQGDIFGKRFLSACIVLYRNDFVYEKTSKEEKLGQFYKILREYEKSPKIIDKYYVDFIKTRKKLLESGRELSKNLTKVPDAKISKLYKNLGERYIAFGKHAVLPESADVYTDKRLLQDMKKILKNILSDSEISEACIILSTYPMLSFMEKERLEFLKLCLMKNPDYGAFSRKYHWIQNNYLMPKFLSERYFQDEVRKLKSNKTEKEIIKDIRSLQNKPIELKRRQEELLKKLPLDVRMEKIFEILRIFSRWIDERKYTALHGISFIDILTQEISKRNKISKDLIGYYTFDEMVRLLESGKKISEHILHERRKLSVYVVTRKGKIFEENILTGVQAKKIFDLLTPKNSGIIKGFVASAPMENFKGRVQVILNPHTQDFITGRILVTTMTRPDFVPLMRKASAIITDEGGITSHAAIISRELKIPCIIGTKVATKALKNGDRVEIDLEKGIVKKL